MQDGILTTAADDRHPELSSERIRARFGSYGVDVLAADGRQRISSLYSLSDGRRICRTYAEVWFECPLPEALADEHARVLAGASIGATFKAAGWHIRRRHLHFGTTRLAPDERHIADLMAIDPEALLATHSYVFHVARGEHACEYACITERHHPEYLDERELARIYGVDAAQPADRPGRSVA